MTDNTSSPSFSYWEDVYCRYSSEMYQLQDLLSALKHELEIMEDTWVESTPIMGCIQTSIEVTEHIIKDLEQKRQATWRQIEKKRNAKHVGV